MTKTIQERDKNPKKKLAVLDLFSGIGGFSLGLERTGGFKTVAFCEIDKFCQQVLRKHWPDVPIHDDIETREFTEGEADVICGGFPCQDISIANAVWGERTGLTGERSGLWREFLRAIRLVRPIRAVLENVAELLGRGMDRILGDLAEIGYDAEWHCIPASAIGAPQERDRVWIVADARGNGSTRLLTSKDIGATRPWWTGSQEDLQLVANAPFERGNSWPQPLVRRMDDGFSGKAQRNHALGNAVVPQIPELIGRAILEAENAP